MDEFRPAQSLQDQMTPGGGHPGAASPAPLMGSHEGVHGGPEAEILNELRRLERQLHDIGQKVDKLVKALIHNE